MQMCEYDNMTFNLHIVYVMVILKFYSDQLI